MKTAITAIAAAAIVCGCGTMKDRQAGETQEIKEVPRMEMTVKKTDDFDLTGDGSAAEWEAADWQPLVRVNGPGTYATRAKVLYSEAGIYFLVDCEDTKLTCTKTQDFDNIFQEDVVEVFLWPNEDENFYFEYEISPLGVELPILVGNHDGGFMGWLPWNYEGGRKTRKATAARGGQKASMAAVDGWTVEFFIPFGLLRGLGNMPPQPGMKWRANIYRIDYDANEPTQWAWDNAIGTNFHDFRNFGTIVFE